LEAIERRSEASLRVSTFAALQNDDGDTTFTNLWLFEETAMLIDAHLGQPDGISPSRMAEMLEVDKAGQKVRC